MKKNGERHWLCSEHRDRYRRTMTKTEKAEASVFVASYCRRAGRLSASTRF
jgi:hypothetical protein